jgi:alkanesulfonate monooxygenase
MHELKFHWRLPQGGERSGASRSEQNSLESTGLPDLEAQLAFCRAAEEVGIHSLLTDFGWAKPDPILLATALGMSTRSIGFIVAYRSGLICPTSFVQQLNTLSCLIEGRFSLNIVAGHSPEEQHYYGDWLEHDDRYARTEEFLGICRALWSGQRGITAAGQHYRVEDSRLNTPFRSTYGRTFPELFIAGNSAQARTLAMAQGTCWMQIATTPREMAATGREILAAGVELGARMSVIARETREEAIDAAHALIGKSRPFDHRRAEHSFVRNSDSASIASTFALGEHEWLTPYLWTGAVRSHGAPAIALVGAAEDVAAGILEYVEAGVSQFILSGWPKLDEMVFFGRTVLPLVRERIESARVVGV